MKTYLPFIFMTLVFISCFDPDHLIRKEKDYKAFETSMNMLERKRIKEKHVLAFEMSFDMITKKDVAKIQELRDAGEPKLWLRILDKAETIRDRQERVRHTLQSVSNKGFFPKVEMYPTEGLIEEATDNVALYYYAQAMEFIPAAENDNRLEARKAYEAFENCLSYRDPYKDANELMAKMYLIGTTHILLEPELDEEALDFSERLFEVFFENNEFPFRKDWRVMYLEKPENETIDYRVNLHFESLYASGDLMDESTCEASAEVQNGTEVIQEWSAADSAYVSRTVPRYETVYMEVITTEQSKYAQLTLVGDLLILKEDEQIPFEFYKRNNWSNSYSVQRGDYRATGCSTIAGGWNGFPSDGTLFEGAARNVKFDFGVWLERETY